MIAPAASASRARARRVRDPRFGLLLRQLRARLVDQRRAIAATRGVIQHRERCTHVTPGGGALRPAEHQPFALRPDLRGQECHAHVARIDGTGLVGELLGGIQMVLLQLGFGVGHQMIDDLFKSVQGARVTRIALQRRAIQFGGIGARRGGEGAGGQRLIGAGEQLLEFGIVGAAPGRGVGRSRGGRAGGCVGCDPGERGGQGENPARDQAPAVALRRPRHGRSSGALEPILVAPPGRFHEQPHALFGNGLVQEAVHRALGDLRREQALLLGRARHDHDQVGKLGVQSGGELADGRGDRRRIEHGNPCLVCHQCGGEVDLGADGAYRVRGIAHRLQGAKEFRVLGERDQRCPPECIRARCDVARRRHL